MRTRGRTARWAMGLLVVATAPFACGRLGYDPLERGDGGSDAVDAASADGHVAAGDAAIDASADAPPAPDATPPPDAMTGAPDASTPTGITLSNAGSTVIEGGTTGNAFSDACPAGQVIIGFDGGLHSPEIYLGSIQATCGVVSIGSGAAGALSVKVTATGQLPAHGITNATLWSRHCPTDQMVFGFDGRSGLYVDALQLVCLKLVVTGGPGSYGLAIQQSTALASVGGTGGAAFTAQRCPTGSVATGTVGRAGDDVDAFGIVCGTYQLAY